MTAAVWWVGVDHPPHCAEEVTLRDEEHLSVHCTLLYPHTGPHVGWYQDAIDDGGLLHRVEWTDKDHPEFTWATPRDQ